MIRKIVHIDEENVTVVVRVLMRATRMRLL